MAFFSDGRNEYFSMNLDPVENSRSLVYRLNTKQILLSKHAISYLLLVSIALSLTIISMCALETFGLSERFLSVSDQELIVVGLSAIATMIAFSEIFFVLWARKNPPAFANRSRSQELKNIVVLSKKSWKAYLIFLLNMTNPFIAILALPGGLPKFLVDISGSGVLFKFLLIQLIIALAILIVFLTKRVGALIVKNPAA